MQETLLQARLFISSYAPLFLILAIRFEDCALVIACALLALVGFVTLGLLLHALKRKNATPYTIDKVSDHGAEVAGYVATYLLPFVTATEPSVRDVIAYVVFLGIVGVIYVRSNMIQINPALYLLGYRVTHVATSDGWDGYLISRRTPRVGQRLLVSRMLNTVALERAADESMGSAPDGRTG